MKNPEPDAHDQGLRADLALIQRRRLERRQTLALLATGIGAVALGGAAPRTLRSSRALPDSCVADAAEMAGPFPADGTNHSNGETDDVLTESGIVRKDIRRSFLSTTTKAKGVKVKLKLTLVNTNAGCMPLPGFAVYIWQCDRDHLYSLYTLPNESYLRGVQVADELGRLSFIAIFPGCYPGRWPHLHLETFTSLAEATNGANSFLTTQLAMPADICGNVYDNARGYRSSREPFSQITLKLDRVFGDDTPEQLAAMTPAFEGSIADGYTATATVGIPA